MLAISDWKWISLQDDRLDELRLEHRRRHLEHRLVREEDRPLGHRAHLTGEAEAREPVEERGVKQARRLEVGQLVGA